MNAKENIRDKNNHGSKESSNSSEGKKNRAGKIIFSLILIIVLIVAIIFVIVNLNKCNRVSSFLPAIKTEQVLTFRDYLSKVIADSGQKLLVGMLETSFVVKKEDTKFFSTTTTKITVPVIYRYYIDLSSKWEIFQKGNVLEVIAPEIRPVLPPAMNTAGMEIESKEGFLRFNEEEQKEEVLKSLTQLISKDAEKPEKFEAVKYQAMLKVEEFIRTWSVQFYRNQDLTIAVKFKDETPSSNHQTDTTMIIVK